MPSKLYQMLNQNQNPQMNQSQQTQNIPQNTMQNAIDRAKSIMNGNGTEMALLKMMIGKQNPKDFFYNKCQEMGVNPDDILKLIK